MGANCQGCGAQTEVEHAVEGLAACGLQRGSARRLCRSARAVDWVVDHELRMHNLLTELFNLHDLNGDGALQEVELISLNEQIAVLHHGSGTDLGLVRKKYRDLFRSALDPEGNAVSCAAFCSYTRTVLQKLDADPVAQEMILEQWMLEAQACRDIFPYDASVDSAMTLDTSPGLSHLVCPSTSTDSDQERPHAPGGCSAQLFKVFGVVKPRCRK